MATGRRVKKGKGRIRSLSYDDDTTCQQFAGLLHVDMDSVVDNEDMVEPSTSDGTLSWHMDPEKSLSDWTIEIVYDQTDNEGAVSNMTDTYHVHKCHLAAGDRKSLYFSKIFGDGGRFSETQESKSRIKLAELAAKAFPDFLDYMYWAPLSPKRTTDTATALYYLGQYFDIPHLRWMVNTFWVKDVTNVEACVTYYEHAAALNQKSILAAAIQACCLNIMQITTTSRLMHAANADFWLKLVASNDPAAGSNPAENYLTVERSCHISKLIAAFCQSTSVDKETFKELTDSGGLPSIDPGVALAMIDMERQIVGPDNTKLTSLQERCIDAFSSQWQTTGCLQQSENLSLLRQQNSLVLCLEAGSWQRRRLLS